MPLVLIYSQKSVSFRRAADYCVCIILVICLQRDATQAVSFSILLFHTVPINPIRAERVSRKAILRPLGLKKVKHEGERTNRGAPVRVDQEDVTGEEFIVKYTWKGVKTF